MRYALGASRGRIVVQLFVEALVLASVAAVVGLARRALGAEVGHRSRTSPARVVRPPFWINPGLKLDDGALRGGADASPAPRSWGCFPRSRPPDRTCRRSSGTWARGGSTLRFGGVWTTAMIVQVALTVICLPPAMGISQEACAIA